MGSSTSPTEQNWLHPQRESGLYVAGQRAESWASPAGASVGAVWRRDDPTHNGPFEGSRQQRVKMHAKTQSTLFQKDTENFSRFSTPSSSAASPTSALASCSVV